MPLRGRLKERVELKIVMGEIEGLTNDGEEFVDFVVGLFAVLVESEPSHAVLRVLESF